MSSCSGVGGASAAQSLSALLKPQTSQRAPDGDTPAQEAAESAAAKKSEAQNGGYFPNSSGALNILA